MSTVVQFFLVELLSCFFITFFHHRGIMQMQYLATMRFFALIHWQLMGLSIGGTHTKRLVESVKLFRTTYMLYLSGQLWLKLMQTWLQLTRIGMATPVFTVSNLICLCCLVSHMKNKSCTEAL